jgi:hypothetical protein
MSTKGSQISMNQLFLHPIDQQYDSGKKKLLISDKLTNNFKQYSFEDEKMCNLIDLSFESQNSLETAFETSHFQDKCSLYSPNNSKDCSPIRFPHQQAKQSRFLSTMVKKEKDKFTLLLNSEWEKRISIAKDKAITKYTILIKNMRSNFPIRINTQQTTNMNSFTQQPKKLFISNLLSRQGQEQKGM